MRFVFDKCMFSKKILINLFISNLILFHLYTVKPVRMQRKKGQFTSSKLLSDEPGPSPADWSGSSGLEGHETL